MKVTAISTLMVIQSILKAPKSQYNSFGKYNYRNCEDILEALKPICKEYNSAVVLTDDVVTIGDRCYVKATATLYCFDENGVDSISASAFAREEQDKKGMDGSQVTGASSSYARKYALNGLFGIDDTKDSDTTNKGDFKPQTEAPKQEHVKAEEKPTMTYEQALEHICEVNGMTIKAIYKDPLLRAEIPNLYKKSSIKTRQAFDIVKAEIRKHNEGKN